MSVLLAALLFGAVVPPAAQANGNTITGTVTAAAVGGLEGISVNAYASKGDYYMGMKAAFTATVSGGAYTLTLPEVGSYYVEFRDNSGTYATQYFDGESTIEDAVTAATSTTASAVLTLAGHIKGTVTESGDGALSDITVCALRSSPNGWWDWVGNARTEADGTYDLGGLPTGYSYKLQFRDDNGDYVTQYYDNQPTFDEGEAVSVPAPGEYSGYDAALALGGHITGTVKNAADDLLANINVNVYASLQDYYNGNQLAGTQTNGDGTYDLGGLPAGGGYLVEFRDDNSGDYLRQYFNGKSTIEEADGVAVTVGTPRTGVDAVLALAGHITGTVTQAGGDPLRDIHVDAMQPTGSGDWPWEYVNGTMTDDDGTYDLGGLPAGDYKLQFRDDAGNYVQQCYNNKPTLDAADSVTVTVGTPRTGVDAVLALAGHITGTVKNAADDLLANINVNAYASLQDYYDGNQAGGTQTNGDGTYDLGGLPAGSGYLVEFRDDNNGDYITQYFNGKSTIEEADGVTVTVGTPGIANAVLAMGGRITGTVTNVGGTLNLADIGVSAGRSGGLYGWDWVGYARTDADGNYDLGGLPTGDYKLEFRDDSGDWGAGDYVTQYWDNEPTLDDGQWVHVVAPGEYSGYDAELVLGGHITGAVTNAGGDPLSEINVNVYASLDDYYQGNQLAGTQTDPDGTYDLGGLPAGSGYLVEFRDDNNGNYITQYFNGASSMEEATGVTVTVGTPRTGVDAELAEGGHITGTVTNEANAGLPNIGVSAARANGPHDWEWVGYTQTDENGDYNLGGLPTGDYKLEFRDDSGDWGAGDYITQYWDNQPTLEEGADVHVVAPNVYDPYDAKMALGGHITGKVTAAVGGGDLANINVNVYASLDDYYQGNQVADTQTNGDGTYDLGGLPAVSGYLVEFRDDNNGDYLTQYFSGKSSIEEATGVTVTVGTPRTGVDAALAVAGHIKGTVTNTHGDLLPNISVFVYASLDDLLNGNQIANWQTDGDGTYDLGGLPAGSGYLVEFRDDNNGDYITQYYDNAPIWRWATPVTVIVGQDTLNIDAALLSTAKPTVTSFTPPSGPVGTSVTLTGTGFLEATGVRFHGTASWAACEVVSDTQITAIVPAGATTGTIAVTTPAGTGKSGADFTVTPTPAPTPTPTPAPPPTPTPTPAVTLKLSGLTSGSITLGKSVTAKGTVTPTSLAGSKVTLTVQKKKGAKWLQVKSAAQTISATGAYSWKYKPAKIGAYRLQAKLAAATAAATPWLNFKVK